MRALFATQIHGPLEVTRSAGRATPQHLLVAIDDGGKVDAVGFLNEPVALCDVTSCYFAVDLTIRPIGPNDAEAPTEILNPVIERCVFGV